MDIYKMKCIGTFLLTLGYGISVCAQYKYENFNKGLPEKWSTTSKIPLSLSSELQISHHEI